MRNLVFAKNINDTNNTGLIDISQNPPEIFCLCEQDKANEILKFQKSLLIISLSFAEFCKNNEHMSAQEIVDYYFED